MEYDYTYQRVGRKFGARKIAICPKCGKKGAYVRITINKRQFDDYLHKAHDMEMGFRHIDDSCMVAVIALGKE
jgi:hypothetical protein